MSSQVPYTTSSTSRPQHKGNNVHYGAANRDDSQQHVSEVHNQGGRRSNGRGPNFCNGNNFPGHGHHHQNQGNGSYYRQHYQHAPNTFYHRNTQQCFQQSMHTYSNQERHPLPPQVYLFHQHQQAQSFQNHDIQISAEKQQELEHTKYYHCRVPLGPHCGLTPDQQQQPKYQEYCQRWGWEGSQKTLLGEGPAFENAYNDRRLYMQPQPHVSQICNDIIEMRMPNGCVEYRYGPGYSASGAKGFRLRGDAPEFMPSEESMSEEVGGDEAEEEQSEKRGEMDKKGETNGKDKAQEKEDEAENEDKVGILTELSKALLDAAEVGRAISAGDEVAAVDVDAEDDPAGFVVKKVFRKRSSALMMPFNVDKTDSGFLATRLIEEAIE